MQNKFIQHRQKAIDWLNGKRDFNEGIQVLESSGFKPGAVRKLKTQGINAPAAKERLKHLMRQLIQAWAMPGDKEIPDTDPDTGLDASQEPEEQHDDISSMKLVEAAEALIACTDKFPKNITKVIREYSDAYKKRDKLHKEMADLPEDNDEATMKQRAKLSEEVEAKTNLMEQLYPLYASYQQDGLDVSDEAMKQLEETSKTEADVEDTEDAEEPVMDYSAMSKDELKTKRKNTATQISRAKNQLEYQKETKGDTPNPMPECPKRVKYEKKIARLTAELEKMDYALAEK